MSDFRYILEEDVHVDLKILRVYGYEDLFRKGYQVDFSNQWLEIHKGKLLVPRGYAWNGCDPSYRVTNDFWIGTPDGTIRQDGKPSTYFASCVHDALCQFRESVPVSKEFTVKLFYSMLRERNFAFSRVYAAAVNLFGPQHWRGF